LPNGSTPGYVTGDTIDYVEEGISTKLKIIFSRGTAIISNSITDEFYTKRKLVKTESKDDWSFKR
jgi:hypothetical protein